MSKKMKKDNNAEMKFKVSANPTGKTKQFGGYDAKEIQMKMAMEMTDQKSEQSGAMVIYTNSGSPRTCRGTPRCATSISKMAEELNWTPGGNMFMQQPEVAKGMAEAFKEVSKLKGTPVFQVMAMGPEGMAPPTADAPQTAAEQPQTKKPSAGSVLGGALGGRLGGFGRKKSEPAQEQPTPTAAATAADRLAAGDADGVLGVRADGRSFAVRDSGGFQAGGIRNEEDEVASRHGRRRVGKPGCRRETARAIASGQVLFCSRNSFKEDS